MNATHLASLIKRHLRHKPQDKEILLSAVNDYEKPTVTEEITQELVNEIFPSDAQHNGPGGLSPEDAAKMPDGPDDPHTPHPEHTAGDE